MGLGAAHVPAARRLHLPHLPPHSGVAHPPAPGAEQLRGGGGGGGGRAVEDLPQEVQEEGTHGLGPLLDAAIVDWREL